MAEFNIKKVMRRLNLSYILVTAPERERLRAEIYALGIKWENRDGGVPPVVAALLSVAASECDGRDLDSGWKYVHEVRRLLIFKYDAKELTAEIKCLESENEIKGQSWRKAAISALLSINKDADDDDTRRINLYQALVVRDEYYDNIYYKMRILRRQIFVLGVFSLVLLFALSLFEVFRSPEKTLNGFDLAEASILGGIGACISGLISFASASPAKQVPETVTNVAITLVRPMIGMISGTVGFLAMKSGLFNSKFTEMPNLLPIAFGFSERLVMGTLQKVR